MRELTSEATPFSGLLLRGGCEIAFIARNGLTDGEQKNKDQRDDGALVWEFNRNAALGGALVRWSLDGKSILSFENSFRKFKG